LKGGPPCETPPPTASLRRRLLFLLPVLAGCGQVSLLDDNLPPLPTITSFTANPAALGPSGGTSLLSWTVVNQDELLLQPGDADVTSYTSASETLAATTTYTLTATNSLGQVTGTVTVTVGP
jgi:hypothetical protein